MRCDLDADHHTRWRGWFVSLRKYAVNSLHEGEPNTFKHGCHGSQCLALQIPCHHGSYSDKFSYLSRGDAAGIEQRSEPCTSYPSHFGLREVFNEQHIPNVTNHFGLFAPLAAHLSTVARLLCWLGTCNTNL